MRPANSGAPAYEIGSGSTGGLLMSLMPLPNGQPPYTICDSYTFTTRPQAKGA
jgi:hypothetical protein